MEDEIRVGIGDMKYAKNKGRIITYALGSCIGISFYDPVIKLGALLHIMLPESGSSLDKNRLKYADTGIRDTLQALEKQGLVRTRTVVKIAGGAKLFEISGQETFGSIGERNARKVRQVLREEGFRLYAEDVGGSSARTMAIDIENGRVSIKTVGQPVKTL